MSQQAEARSWWADVEHLREAAEARHATPERHLTPEASMNARLERVRAAERRTVQITGYGAQTSIRPTPSELRGPRPDRIAAWGVGFAIFLALLAALVGG
jgi:hypothetical protein